MRKFRGNTAAEYGIIGAVIIGATVVLVLLVGQNLDSALKGLKGDMQGSVASAEGYQKKVQAERYNKAVGSSFTGATLNVCTGKLCVEVPYSKQNAAVVRTSGGLGNRELSTGQFIRLLNDVVPTLTKEEVENLLGKLLTQLSSTTYQVSDSQYTLAQICQGVGSCDYKFNIPDEVYDKLSRKEKWKIRERVQEINELKAMIDQLKDKGLTASQQNVVDSTVAETKTQVATMNTGNITTAAAIVNNDGTQQATVANQVGGSATVASTGGSTTPALTSSTGIVGSQAENQAIAAANAAAGDVTAIKEVKALDKATSATNNTTAASVGATGSIATTAATTTAPVSASTSLDADDDTATGTSTTGSSAAITPSSGTTSTTTPTTSTTTTNPAVDGAVSGAATGAVVGAVTGAAVGAVVGGPVGAAAGALIGAVVGAGAGAVTGAGVGTVTGGGGETTATCATGDCSGASTGSGTFTSLGEGGGG